MNKNSIVKGAMSLGEFLLKFAKRQEHKDRTHFIEKHIPG